MDYLSKIEDDIRLNGWALVPIISDGNSPSFAYTVGLSETYEHSELLIFGLSAQSAYSVINNVVNSIELHGSIKTSIRNPTIIEKYDVVFVDVDIEIAKEYTLFAKDYYKEEPFSVMQVVWPDEEANFPWDKKFNKGFDFKQPLLGSVDQAKMRNF